MARSLGCGGIAQSDDSIQFKRAAESACEMGRSLGCWPWRQDEARHNEDLKANCI